MGVVEDDPQSSIKKNEGERVPLLSLVCDKLSLSHKLRLAKFHESYKALLSAPLSFD